jgi:hypothetical protein
MDVGEELRGAYREVSFACTSYEIILAGDDSDPIKGVLSLQLRSTHSSVAISYAVSRGFLVSFKVFLSNGAFADSAV